MDYDAIVVGAGHAGIEAALAISRIGFNTLLVTQNLDAIGRLSCNPAIGGLSKGNIVREVDALGGEMAHLIDSTLIQYRILNRKRGPAVQAPRAQADKFSYSRLAKETCENQNHLDIFMDTVVDLMVDGTNKKVIGVKTRRGHNISSKAVVITTGTFMEGRIFIGEFDAQEGRLGEEAALGLGKSLRRMGFELGRLKTGTPARVDFNSLDFDKMERQNGDDHIFPFSFSHSKIEKEQLPCWITYSNDKTHEIIRKNIKRSPLFGGKISGKGPRYCPSIEDKVMRFPDRDRHQVFVEPEGSGSCEMYLNGLSSSLPEDVQNDFIHSVEGLENAKIMRPAYAVEYDYVFPTQLYASLETKLYENLFIAGQTNGTSGYEEAACQGLMAGINVCQKLRGEEPLVLSRSEAYIGVLIDDLVTKGTKEPYRMFTSRAEYRLNLRHDTADERLTNKGFEVGLASKEALERLDEKRNKVDTIMTLLASHKVNNQNALESLRRPEVTLSSLEKDISDLSNFSEDLKSLVENNVKYEGYVKRQERQAEKFNNMEKIKIPKEFNYDEVKGLSSESKEKLKAILPLSIGQASRISGVRTSDIALLMVYMRRRNGK